MPDPYVLEKAFDRVLEDLGDRLTELTLVGGWVPFIYARHVWKEKSARIVTTADIDFGLTGAESYAGPTVFETLEGKDYQEHRIDIGRLWPIVLYKDGKIPVEFLADLKTKTKAITAVLGPQVYVNKLEGLDFLLKDRIMVKRRGGKKTLFCPRPSRFLVHKIMTFTERDDDFKKAKDLMYAYFILRYIPDRDRLFQEAREFREDILIRVENNIDKYFSRVTGLGCLWVEKENGPDAFIQDVRKDVWERFNRLKAKLNGNRDSE